MEEFVRKNPWLGLESYKEGEILYGRDDDIRDLSQCVLNDIDTLLYGKSGIGKTHLLHAIGNYLLKTNPNKRVYYVSSAEFLDEYVNAIRSSQIDEFKESFKQNDILLIDDIQFLASREKVGEYFFSIFNLFINSNKQIIMTSDRPPLELKGLEDRLVSRFASGLSVAITSPEYERPFDVL